MRIAVPVEEMDIQATVSESFGRAPYYLFYNTITEEIYYLDNSAMAVRGGAGARAAQVIADHGVQALLVPRCGVYAEKALRNAEVFVYKTIPGTAKQNIDAFMENKLMLLDEFHSGFHGSLS